MSTDDGPRESKTLVERVWQAVSSYLPLEALSLVRLLALILLLLLALADAEPTRVGLPTWSFIALYAAYSLLIGLLGRHWHWLPTWLQSVLDLAVAGVLYLISGRGEGAVFILVLVAVVSAVATLPVQGALRAIVAATLILIAGDLLRRQSWSFGTVVPEIGSRLLTLGFVAFVTAILVHRLNQQQIDARQAQLQAEQLAELDRLRANFVAAVSHDLQTPLTAVRAALKLLELSVDERLKSGEMRLLANARRNVDRLGLQITDLLAFNQITAHEFEIIPSPLDLRTVVATAVSVAHPLLEQKGQTLRSDVTQPLVVEGDRRRLEQVVLNLVMNSHQHTPEGTTITIKGHNTDDGVILQVCDDGPGIPETAQETVFDRFARLDTTSGGSGLGLAIVKAVVEAHGGHVRVESGPGGGATFSVMLPSRMASTTMDIDRHAIALPDRR